MQQVTTETDVSRPMVWRWQQRFTEEGPGGLLRDKDMQAWSAAIPAETVAPGRAMEGRWGLAAVQRIWPAHQLQPSPPMLSEPASPAMRLAAISRPRRLLAKRDMGHSRPQGVQQEIALALFHLRGGEDGCVGGK